MYKTTERDTGAARLPSRGSTTHNVACCSGSLGYKNFSKVKYVGQYANKLKDLRCEQHVVVMMQEEEALAQANGNMDPQDDLPPQEDEQLGYPEDEAQPDTLEQVRTALTYAVLL